MSDAPIVGLDGGGTGCRARVYAPDGTVLGRGEGGPANLLIGDGSVPFASIMQAVEAALSDAGLGREAMARARVGLGVAAATPEGLARLAARKPPFAETRVVTDGHAAALGAHRGRDGAAVIMGTGACATATLGGVAREIGGWGLAVDDAGSGGWIGRRLMRAALRSRDGEEGLEALGEIVLARWSGDVRQATDWGYAAKPGDFGALAPLAFTLAEQGDAAADAILQAATAELARLIRLSAKAGAPRVSLFGSVALRLAPRLGPEEAALLTAPQGDAVDGAMLALRLGLGAKL